MNSLFAKRSIGYQFLNSGGTGFSLLSPGEVPE